MRFGDGQNRNAGWRKTIFWKSNRRVGNLGAFAKWARENPSEHQRIEARHAAEEAEREKGKAA